MKTQEYNENVQVEEEKKSLFLEKNKEGYIKKEEDESFNIYWDSDITIIPVKLV